MSPDLKAHIAAAVVLISDAKQDPDQIHQLLQAIAEQAECEGEMAGLDKAQRLMDKHLTGLVIA